MEYSSFDPHLFLQHLQSGADPLAAPGLIELLEEVEQCARQLIGSNCNIPAADLDDGARDVSGSVILMIIPVWEIGFVLKVRKLKGQFCIQNSGSIVMSEDPELLRMVAQ